jgi:ankyrin repeat protein
MKSLKFTEPYQPAKGTLRSSTFKAQKHLPLADLMRLAVAGAAVAGLAVTASPEGAGGQVDTSSLKAVVVSSHANASSKKSNSFIKNSRIDLMDAALNQDAARIKELLKEGVDPAALDSTGMSPIRLCVSLGLTVSVQLMLDFPRIDLEAKDANGWTLLRAAIAARQTGMAALLLERGAKVDTQDKTLSTPAMCAASSRLNNAFDMLIGKYHANLALKDAFRQTVVDYALDSKDADIIISLNRELARRAQRPGWPSESLSIFGGNPLPSGILIH